MCIPWHRSRLKNFCKMSSSFWSVCCEFCNASFCFQKIYFVKIFAKTNSKIDEFRRQKIKTLFKTFDEYRGLKIRRPMLWRIFTFFQPFRKLKKIARRSGVPRLFVLWILAQAMEEMVSVPKVARASRAFFTASFFPPRLIFLLRLNFTTFEILVSTKFTNRKKLH